MDVKELISVMTLEEKTAVMMGADTWRNYGIRRLGIPELTLSDGPTGLRKQADAGDHLGLNASLPATCFPSSATMANSWDEELEEEVGRAIGTEALSEKVMVLLGPGLNIKRNPLCGRNFEYFSEDPVVSGKMAAAYIRGIQSAGVAACPKHFAVNSQEYKRMASDSVVDERTLRELYLIGFEIAVKEGKPKAIMSSYNMVNGTYAHENKYLLTDILRKEWGFDGFVVSDWGGSNSRTASTKAGANLEMPAAGADSANGLISDVKEGRLDESVIDDRLCEILPQIFELSANIAGCTKKTDYYEHHTIARKAATGSIVLLENDGILPLDDRQSVALIGEFAKKPRFQGAGSSMVNPTCVDNLESEFANNFNNYIGYAPGYQRTGAKKKKNLTAEAVAIADKADVVVFCMGLDEILESEGMDRRNMKLPEEQIEVLKKISEVNRNIVLVLSGGAPFCMPDKSLYRGVIHGYLGGQAGAGAMYDVLTGRVVPSGKLAESWPMKLEDTPSFEDYPCTKKHVFYRESMYVGYRYYEKRHIETKYPFGYGLSYTSFAYSNIQYKNGKVCFEIKNIGEYDGSEICQIYVEHSGRVFGPDKKLAGFKKVFLNKGECKRVEIDIPKRAFEFYNPFSSEWECEGGSYKIYAATSSADVKLSAEIVMEGNATGTFWKDIPHYMSGDVKSVTDEEFENLYGRDIPKNVNDRVLGINDAVCEIVKAKSGVARLAGRIIENKKIKSDKSNVPNLNIYFIYNMPFRAIAKMTMGFVSMKMVDDIMIIINGSFFKGFGKLVADFFRNLSQSKKYKKKISE